MRENSGVALKKGSLGGHFIVESVRNMDRGGQTQKGRRLKAVLEIKNIKKKVIGSDI